MIGHNVRNAQCFSVGQTLYINPESTARSSSAMATGSISHDNGVEMDFQQTNSPRPTAGQNPAPPPAGSLTNAHPGRHHPRTPQGPGHLPQRTLQSVASLYERQPKAGRFSALDPARKINFIASVTGVPYRTIKEFSDRPGELGLVMGRGLSTEPWLGATVLRYRVVDNDNRYWV